ncbi:MAG: pseudaminic acid synthase [Cyclobacteriaceae bacterium]
MIISDFVINEDSDAFIIAELSANHNGSLKTAIETVKAAKEAGADCIKLQTYTPDTITLNVKNDNFLVKGTIWNGKYLYDLYMEAYTPWEWHEELFRIANEEGLVCFSSPFDRSSVDFLENLQAPAYKIASYEITDIPLIDYVSKQGKPIIISTGIANEVDIQKALDVCRKNGVEELALLKCTSAYPAEAEDANLIMIKDYRKRFNVVSGLSDHTVGLTVPIMSVAYGAKIIEKHLILDRSIGGPDEAFSLTKNEFKLMVDHVREAEKAIGRVDYSLDKGKIKGREHSRSIWIVDDVKMGDTITEENIRVVRPNVGLAPEHYFDVIGKKFTTDLPKGEPLKKSHFK